MHSFDYQQSFYPEAIMDYVRRLPNSGALNVDNKTVFLAEVGDIQAGVKIKLYIKINNAIIERVKYLVYGDGYMIALLGALSEQLIGLKISNATGLSLTHLAQQLSVPQGKISSLKIIKQAIENILLQYEQNTNHARSI